MPLSSTTERVTLFTSLIYTQFQLLNLEMKTKQIKITFEYTNPNTCSVVSVFTAIFGIVLVLGVVLLCIFLM